MNALLYERYLKSGSEQPCHAPEAQRALGPPGWEVNLGPIAFGNRGLSVKPQLMFGAKWYNFQAEAGLHDLRDGVKVNANAQAYVDAFCQARSIAELHSSIEMNTAGFKEALEAVKWLLSTTVGATGSAVEMMAAKLNMNHEALSKLLHGVHQDQETDRRPMMLRVKVSTGVGVCGEVRLGWTDHNGAPALVASTQPLPPTPTHCTLLPCLPTSVAGYRMIGVGGKASAGLKVGANVFVGTHWALTSIKIEIGVGNFDFCKIPGRMYPPCACGMHTHTFRVFLLSAVDSLCHSDGWQG